MITVFSLICFNLTRAIGWFVHYYGGLNSSYPEQAKCLKTFRYSWFTYWYFFLMSMTPTKESKQLRPIRRAVSNCSLTRRKHRVRKKQSFLPNRFLFVAGARTINSLKIEQKCLWVSSFRCVLSYSILTTRWILEANWNHYSLFQFDSLNSTRKFHETEYHITSRHMRLLCHFRF